MYLQSSSEKTEPPAFRMDYETLKITKVEIETTEKREKRILDELADAIKAQSKRH